MKTDPATVRVSVSKDGTALDILSTQDNPLMGAELFDLSGRLVGEQTLPSKEIRLSFPIRHLPAGLYILSVRTIHSRSEHKIIKR
jgi:hypothetical protein